MNLYRYLAMKSDGHFYTHWDLFDDGNEDICRPHLTPSHTQAAVVAIGLASTDYSLASVLAASLIYDGADTILSESLLEEFTDGCSFTVNDGRTGVSYSFTNIGDGKVRVMVE